ncbi:hypothetical protein yaldo0001_15270 [Yersinia aldovae ATCC 35236]|nr:hypothetical protein yaldo0001_15270 [Yersinia aldovae ATCC 35236]
MGCELATVSLFLPYIAHATLCEAPLILLPTAVTHVTELRRLPHF